MAALFGVRDLLFGASSDRGPSGRTDALRGLAFAVIGAVSSWWHLREARRREEGPHADVFWGRSLYFHLVAAVALGFVLTGLALLLGATVDLVLPECAHFDRPFGAVSIDASGSCVPTGREATIGLMVDYGIILVVSAPVWFWHLRRGRQLTTGA